MVVFFEVVTVLVLGLVGFLWFRRTPIYRARRDHGVAPGQYGTRTDFGMYQPSQPPPPPAALHDLERPGRRRRPRDR
jgi:hypothetical protein